MLEFRKITLESRSEIESYIAKGDFRGAEYNFSHIYLWSRIYPMEYAVKDGMLSVYARFDKPGYCFPVGEGDPFAMIDELILDAQSRGEEFLLRAITKEDADRLAERYEGRFLLETNRDYSDYVYSREKLATLSGKKLHGKRNHINRFMENYPDWKYEKITDENLADVFAMSHEWCMINNCNADKDLKNEMCAVKVALNNMEALGLRGGLIRADGRVVAFSVGRPISKDTFGVHVEKAFYDIQGAYPMINQQFVIHETEGFLYVNREEDTGDEGLRKAKLSYYPEFLVDRYTATLK